jgi:hypothetical protein
MFGIRGETALDVSREICMTIPPRQIMNDQTRAPVRGVWLSRQVCSCTVFEKLVVELLWRGIIRVAYQEQKGAAGEPTALFIRVIALRKA